MADIFTKRPIVSDVLLRGLSDQDVATVHEAMGRRGAMHHLIKPIDRKMRMCGRALTVRCQSGDNLMLIKAVSMARPGDVIVADMGPLVDNGPFGEVLAVECLTKKMAGILVSCSVRDSEAIIERNFPTFSAGLSVIGTVKASKGEINHPVVVGGVLVNPGDVVLGDADGVVVIPYAEAEMVLAAANARKEKEAVVMEKLSNGASLFDLYGYGRIFDQLGVTEE